MSEGGGSDLDALKRCRLGADETVARRIDSIVRKSRRKRYVQFPQLWIERLEGVRHVSTYRVALRILQRHRQYRGRPFPLPNNIGGVSRCGKSTALVELEEAGLIQVERRNRKSPLVTAVMLDEEDRAL
jgi:hypothetical protein